MKKTTSFLTAGLIFCLVIPGCASQDDVAESGRYEPLEVSVKIAETGTSEKVLSAPGERQVPDLAESSELSDYLVYAALNNPGLRAAFNRWKAALERQLQVKMLPDPRFNYGYFIEEVETRVGPQRNSYGLSQVFPWFGKLELRGDAAMDAARAAREHYEVAKLKLFYDVKEVYYEYYYLAKSLAVTNENVNLIKHLESVARSRYKAGAGTHPDVIRAQVELGKMEDRYLTLEDLREPIVAQLNAVLNRPVDANIPWPREIELEQISIPQDQLVGLLTKVNPEIKALEYDVARSRDNIELAKKDYYPDITLGFTLIDTGDAVFGSPPDSGTNPVIAGVSINLPIWREKYDAAVREAKSLYYAARREKVERTNSLTSELKMAIYRFTDAERKIDLYGNALLPKARESLKVTESQFRAASGTFTDLIDAQRIFLEFALAYERALADRGQSLAKLEMLVGREITGGGNQSTVPNVINKESSKDLAEAKQ